MDFRGPRVVGLQVLQVQTLSAADSHPEVGQGGAKAPPAETEAEPHLAAESGPGVELQEYRWCREEPLQA